MNLIICLTPLQMLIAEKIVKQKQLKNNVLVVIAYNDNDKFRYHYERLSNLCDKSYFFLIDNSNLLSRVKTMATLKKFLTLLNKNTFSSCYLASIDCSYIQLITSGIKYQNLYTFDDGTINLISDSPYYKDKNYSFFEKVFRCLFNIKDTVSLYRQKSVLHYTIFRNSKNIIDNIEFISLIDGEYGNNKQRSDVVKMFLGQPLSEIEIDKETLLSFLTSENIDYYYPHPREIERFEGIQYIESEKIFEDYLISYLAIHPNARLEIYTFFSTTILNINNFTGVNVIALFSKRIPRNMSRVYDIFRKNNIEIRDIL